MQALRAEPATSCGSWQLTHRLCASAARPSIVAIVVWHVRHERGTALVPSPWGSWQVVQRSWPPGKVEAAVNFPGSFAAWQVKHRPEAAPATSWGLWQVAQAMGSPVLASAPCLVAGAEGAPASAPEAAACQVSWPTWQSV